VKPLLNLAPAFRQYRRLLIQRQRELLQELRVKQEDFTEPREPAQHDDQPAIEQASSVTDELSAIESSELSRIREALERLDSERYGICERCSGAISSSRLLAIPWAERCHRCEARLTSNTLAEIGNPLGCAKSHSNTAQLR
jgi:DnaK suppressor protein